MVILHDDAFKGPRSVSEPVNAVNFGYTLVYIWLNHSRVEVDLLVLSESENSRVISLLD